MKILALDSSGLVASVAVVEDDGVGFKPVKQRSIRKVGLLAMQDSVRLLGGTISIKSTPGKGTRIEVACPCVVYGGNE